MMEANHFDSGDVLHHRFHRRPRDLDQMASDLFEQVSAFLGLERFHEMLFGRGQNPRKPDNNQIINQMRTNIFRPAAHVFLLKAAHALGNGTFNLALRFH